MRLVKLICTSAGDRPASGPPSTVNRRRSRRLHERLNDATDWRWYLADREPLDDEGGES